MLDSVGAGQTRLADRGYDSDILRKKPAERGAKANIKPMRNRINIPNQQHVYQKRNLIKRFFDKTKHASSIVIRYEKHDANL